MESVSKNTVPAKMQHNILDPVDDALVLDAPDSDVENGDSSIVTVISALDKSQSPHKSHPNGLPQSPETVSTTDTEVVSKSSSDDRKRQSSSSVGGQGDVPGKEDRPTSRRRQWGGHSRAASSGLSLSTDKLEKLVPTLTTEPSGRSTRSGSSVQSSTPAADTAKETPISRDDERNSRTTSKDSGRSRHPNSQQSKDLDSSKTVLPERRAPNTEPDKASPTENDSKTVPSPNKRKGPKETKAVGYLVEAPERVEPSQPAKHKPTNIVYIRSLVRPFTADQLRQMISDHYGPVEELWLDRIKSSSLVRMQTAEGAERCREGLDGSRWPSMNPRTLRCDFGNDALFDWMKANGASGDQLPPKHLVLGQAEENTTDSPTTAEEKSSKDSRSDRIDKRSSGGQSSRKRSELDPRNKESSPRRKSPEPKEAPEAKKPREEPAKLLDDLFRKTTSAPSVYWLPLTDEEAKKQAEERLKIFAAKRSVYTRTARPTQRATRSPFASPGPNETATSKSAETTSAQAPPVAPKPAQPERSSEPSVVTKETTAAKESVSETKSKSQRSGAVEPSQKKPSAKPSADSETKKEEKHTQGPRKRDRSPFTPERKRPRSPPRRSVEKSSRTTASSSANKRPRSRTPSPPRPRPPRATRRRCSSSRSSSGRDVGRRRRESSSHRRDRRSPPSSSKYTRARSRSVERRAISPPTHRSYGRSHR